VTLTAFPRPASGYGTSRHVHRPASAEWIHHNETPFEEKEEQDSVSGVTSGHQGGRQSIIQFTLSQFSARHGRR
jgi:hypothetical protein